jgi:hypothetical protein
VGARMKTPTLKQYGRLRCVANPGCELVSGITGPYRQTWRQLLWNGWVAPAHPEISTENGLRITPLGLRVLALALEAHGYPHSGGEA